MDNNQVKPKKAFRPSKAYAIVPMLCVAMYAPFCIGGISTLFAFILIGLPIICLITSYRAGISLAKFYPTAQALIYLIASHLASIILALSICFIFHGYPIKACFDACEIISIPKALLIFLAVSFIVYAPGYHSLELQGSKKA